MQQRQVYACARFDGVVMRCVGHLRETREGMQSKHEARLVTHASVRQLTERSSVWRSVKDFRP